MASRVALGSSWLELLEDVFEEDYMGDLRDFLIKEKKEKKQIYPSGKNIFTAFNSTSVEEVRVVIIGQDPYHGPGQAHGLCFSVQADVSLPPSLINILSEVARDLGLQEFSKVKGDLSGWAQQGVLLLNSTLTVERGKAGSHQGKGWETFTDQVIERLGRTREHLVFMLWGGYAQKKGEFLDRKKHMVLTAPHPSPLSAHRGFLGCGHFSKANHYLIEKDFEPIHWNDVR
jgi:uracil-DNA glycosylase